MIFVTLGSQKFQFNRLLKKIDELICTEGLNDEVFAQIGYSDYTPERFQYQKFLNREEFEEKIEKADIVITHGGTGAIIGAVKKKKVVIAVPRKSEYGEHVDNHQFQIVEQFKAMNLIVACYEIDKMADAIENSKKLVFPTYVSNTKKYINSIEEFIESI